MTQEFSLERFQQLAAAYGANPQRWPEEERALYTKFMRAPEAQLPLASAQQVDLFLNAWQMNMREEPFIDATLAKLPLYRPQQKTDVRQMTGSALMLILIALLGFSNGYFNADLEPASHELSLAFDMPEEE